jgi:hypothetical protein
VAGFITPLLAQVSTCAISNIIPIIPLLASAGASIYLCHFQYYSYHSKIFNFISPPASPSMY